MSKKMKILAGAVLLVVLLGAFMAVPALAQPTTPTPTPKVTNGWGKGFGWGRGLGCWGGGSWTEFDAAAQALGLTPEQLFAELHAGKSLSDIATAKGVDLQKVYDAMNADRIAAMKASIEQAVKDGKLTQAQADWLLKGMELGFYPKGRGFGHGFGGFRFPFMTPKSSSTS
ncbi:MAG: hypothetical protein FJZ89_12615 [Chloroflexi bacterium]|nr:hypothetical protein [Chloroflexota bacterium]